MCTLIIGIDPGFSGAVAFLDADTRELLRVEDMPVAPGRKGKTMLLHSTLYGLLAPYGLGLEYRATAWVEDVGAMPGQGVSSMFRFGRVVGAIEMAVAAAGIPIQRVTPAVWKRSYGIGAGKGLARALASERFPAMAESFKRVKDDGRAEAALIALYGAERGQQ